MKELNKIIIIGEAGRGKSTLAEKLSRKLGIPHRSTDDFFYIDKFSKVREREEALIMIKEFYKEPRWIVEGTTVWLLEPGVAQADKIIHLRHKSIFSQWLILMKRYFNRNEDTLVGTIQLMRHVFYKRYGLGYKKGKMTHAEFIEPHKEKVITLSSFKDIDNLLENLN